MKAAGFQENGGPEKIQLLDVPKPTIKADQVLVEVKTCGLNYFDLLVLREENPDNPSPFWGGADIAGVVAETGENAAGFNPGDRVLVNPGLSCGKCERCIAGEESLCVDFGIIGDSYPGGFAEYAAVPVENLLHLPETLSFEEAAAVPLVFQTAWRAVITQAKVLPGEDVVVLGASGGVGSAAVQIAKLAGARVIAVTSSEEKIALVKKLGADAAFNRNEADYWEKINRLTGRRGVDVVIENIGAATWKDSINSLRKGGRLVTYGRTSGRIGETNISTVFWNQLQIIGTTMSSRSEFNQVMQLVFDRKLLPVIDRVFPLEEAAQAYQRLADGAHFGKIIIQPGRVG
ncbi:MAG: zinc-binding dehydrogenase [Anaerolineae bacterium]|nr:zinc-binding dehydrogenase [Anaerolineae bacterium]